MNGEYEFGENLNDDAAVVFSDNLKDKWFCLVGGPGTTDITFKNDYPYNLNTRYAEIQRKTGPSDADKKWADQRGIPLMTIDYSDSMIRSEDPIDSPTSVYVVGPSSRTINNE